MLLYEGNGKQSSITISQSAAGFSRLGICVRNNQNGNVESYVEVINPDGRTVGIALGTNQWSTPAVESITISGASLSVTSFGGTGAGFMFVIGYK